LTKFYISLSLTALKLPTVTHFVVFHRSTDITTGRLNHIIFSVKPKLHPLYQYNTIRCKKNASCMRMHVFPTSCLTEKSNTAAMITVKLVTYLTECIHQIRRRLICGLNKFDHISHVLCDRLHWLPVPQRIHYKLCLLVYKALHGLAPQYLSACFFGQWQKQTAIIHIVISTSTNF